MNTIWNNASYRATINRTSGDMPTFSVKFVATIGGTTYTIDASTIKQINFATDSVSGDGFTFGDFVGRSCDLTFFDISAAYSGVALKGAYGELSYGVVSGGITTWISYGTFVVEDVKRDGGVVWMSLVDLRKRFGKVGFSPSSTGLTLFQLAQEVVAAANVVVGLPTVELGNTSSNMPNGSLVLTNVGSSEIKSGNSPVSLSQMVCYIAQATGTFATIGSDNKLYFKWYAEPTNACLIASTFVPNSIELSEYSVGVTGISWTDLEGNTTTNGSDGYMIQITDNPLTFANYATVLSGMESRVIGFTYTPLAFTYVGNPAIEVGDMITVVDDKNVSRLFPVTSMRYSNLLSQTISAVEGADSTDSGSTGLSITQQIKNSANNVIAYARIMELDADNITTGTLIAQVLTNDRTDPVCWASIGESVVDGDTYHGIAMYNRTYSTTVPAARMFVYDGTDSHLRIEAGNGSAISMSEGGIQISTLGTTPNHGMLNLDDVGHLVQLIGGGGQIRIYGDSVAIHAPDLTWAEVFDSKIIIKKYGHETVFDSSEMVAEVEEIAKRNTVKSVLLNFVSPATAGTLRVTRCGNTVQMLAWCNKALSTTAFEVLWETIPVGYRPANAVDNDVGAAHAGSTIYTTYTPCLFKVGTDGVVSVVSTAISKTGCTLNATWTTGDAYPT